MLKFKSIAIILSVLFVITSCEKNQEIEQKISDNENIQLSQFPSMEAISFSVDDNILNFETAEDYQLMLDYMCDIQEYDYDDFEELLCFHSYRKEYKKLGKALPSIDVESFVLLNPEGSIIIENHKFTLNFYTKEIEVQEITENGLKNLPFQFTWDQAVLDILFNGGQNSYHKSTDKFSACSSNSIGTVEWETGPSDVTLELYYNNTPLAYKLKAKISQSPVLGGLQLQILSGTTCDMTYWQSRNDCEGYTKNLSGTSSSLSWTIYSDGFNRLDGYDVQVIMSATYDGSPYDHDSNVFNLECDVSSITCD